MKKHARRLFKVGLLLGALILAVLGVSAAVISRQQSPQPVTALEVAQQILADRPTYTCPNVTAMSQWVDESYRRFNKPAGALFTQDETTQLRQDNELFWACYIARLQEYQAEAKELQYQPEQGNKSVIINQAPIQAPKVNLPPYQPYSETTNCYRYSTGEIRCTTTTR